jgi:hypothetical protein
VTATTRSGTNTPTFSSFIGGTFLYYFGKNTQPTNEQSLYFTCQLPHSYKEGTNLFPHVHYVPNNTTNTGQVVWGLEYTWTNINGVFGPTNTIIGITPIIGNEGNVHHVTELGSSIDGIDGTGKLISSMLVCRIFRQGESASDTYVDPNGPGLMEVDFHFQQCGIGSGTQFQK